MSWLLLTLSSLFFLGIWARLLFGYARHRHRRLLWDEGKLKAVEIECGLREPDPPYQPPPGTLGAPDPFGSVPASAGGPGLSALEQMWEHQPASPVAARPMTEAELAEVQFQDEHPGRRERASARRKREAEQERLDYEKGRRETRAWLDSL